MKATLKKLALSTAALAFAATSPAAAQQSTPTPVEPAQVAAADVEMSGPALWKIADEDTTIYLFGTVHALPEDVDWNTGSIGDALQSSDTLVTEIDMTPESLGQMQGLVMGKGLLPAGTTLRSLMSDEQKATYEAGIAKLGVPAEALDPLEPWLAAIQMSQIFMQKAGFKAESGVEAVLEKAVKEGTKRDALETVEFQINVFDEMPREAQLQFLLQSLEDPEGAVKMLDQLVVEWAEGDISTLASLMNEALLSSPVLAQRLLYMRNAYWAGWIDARMDQPGTVFVAVGAGHLAGEQSVQDFLAGKGISSTRVQ